MSVLVIGGDKIESIRSILLDTFGILDVVHWDARKKSSACKKTIPKEIGCVVMLTSFLNHNAMKHFKDEAKKRELPVVCTRHSSNSFYSEYVKVMGEMNCMGCNQLAKCTLGGENNGASYNRTNR